MICRLIYIGTNVSKELSVSILRVLEEYMYPDCPLYLECLEYRDRKLLNNLGPYLIIYTTPYLRR